MAGLVTVTTDERAIARADKRLSKYMGRDLATRAKKVYLEGAKLGIPAIRAASPVGRTGRLRASTAAKSVRTRGGIEIAVASVGPRGSRTKGSRRNGSHKLPVILGHRVVTHAGRDTGRFVPGNPYVERAEAQYRERAQSFIATRVLDIGGFGGGGITSRAPSGISTF